jgi:hypothetical protein
MVTWNKLNYLLFDYGGIFIFILQAILLEWYPVQVKRHSSLNSCKGVVSSDCLDRMTDEEIQSALTDWSMSKLCRLIGNRSDKAFPLRIALLTFEVPILPSWIYVGYWKVL